MYVTLVHVHVKPDKVAEFIELMRANHAGSVREPANLRFDVLQSADDPTRFVIYEAFRDEAGAKAHKETRHYAAFKTAAEVMMAEPRQGIRYDGLLPAQPESGL
jgi:autoinducer 2-degrading protein